MKEFPSLVRDFQGDYICSELISFHGIARGRHPKGNASILMSIFTIGKELITCPAMNTFSDYLPKKLHLREPLLPLKVYCTSL